MKKNENLIKEFDIEVLEKRFEMGQWISSVKVGAQYENLTASVTFEIPPKTEK